MDFKILQQNINKSMQCNISWNGERVFEVVDKGFTHYVDIVRRTCSCRAWQLKGIPCPHGVAALHYKQNEPIHYVASCYNKETYLRTYEYVIQPMNNMNMWPPSVNPTVQPPPVKQLPRRPSKARRKEVNETNRTGKLNKCGAVMTCSNCHTKGHNKRGCHILPTVPTQTATTFTQAQVNVSIVINI
ncbi:hypothetical protein MTR67_045313 [Solanum verrucosum]|uniref:SWIM-type domain-containing protein n=1 Tax=Solanum verrucosum TaxID=315347 RepID=A0AAF0UV60_SOLVR|nr:hypothetical protein MTR67_045313 [Solanum verrucosum]